nr:MAG TPA: PolyVal ADP-Ribosyltransferase [Caudoviricetes sp.]
MGWQDIYKRKMEESGLEAGEINFVDVDTFRQRERERWDADVAAGKIQTVKTPETTVETPANSGERKITVSPGGTFLGGFSFTAPRQKTAQELADEAKQQQAYLAEYERLSTLDLEALEKEVDEAKQAAKGSHGMYDIKAFGGGDLPTQQDGKYAALQTDLNKARSIQYEKKGREALDKLTEEQSAALEVLNTERSDTAKRQAAWQTMQQAGYSDEEISQLANYHRNVPRREKNAETYTKVQEAGRNEGDTAPVFGTLLSVPANLLSGIGSIDAAMKKLADPDTPTDYNAPAMLPYAYASGVRGEVTKNLQYDHGDNAAFLYGVGTSVLDSAATAALTALGVPAAAASATLGGAAATDAMVTAKDRGLDDTHAIISGVAAGVFETFFEKYSLENLISMKLPTGTMKQRLAGLLKNTATQAGVEGSEEMFTDLANLMVDKIANGDMADVSQRIAVYMAGGMSYQDAQQKVANETVKDIAVDFAAGALAGGVMGGGNMAVQTAAHNRYQDAVKQVRERAGITGSFQTSEDGRTSYNDNEAQIRSVVKEGKVELASGETVDPKDVRFKDQQTADLYEGAISSAENAGAAQVFVDSYTGGDVSQYLLGMQQAYAAGRSGIAQEDMTPGTFADDLSEAQFRAAYAQGQAATEAEFPVMRDMGLGENGSAAWAEVQRTSRTQSKGKLQAGFTVMYQAGLRREAASSVKSAAASALPQSVQTAAYKAGLSDAAASLAREKAGLDFVSSAGSESGLVDSEYAQRLAQEKAGTAALLNTMGKELGLRVEIVPTVRGGSANGQYVASRNLIQIAADADNAIDFVAAHEVTHRMQELAPEEYRAYRDHAMRYRARESGEEGAAAYVERYRAMAEEAGVKLTQEEAMDEIAADFTRDMMVNGKLFESFAKENRPAAKRMLDALKAFIEKIKALFRGKEARDAAAQSAYGKDMAELEACAALWQKAYDAAAKQAQMAKTAAREGDGEGRYQIKNIDGRLMTVIDTQNDTRDFKAAEAYLKTLVNSDHPFSTILMDAQPVYVGKDLPGEYKGSEYTHGLNSAVRKVKMQAATNLDEMLLLAENGEWRENVKPKHAKDAQNGWYRYDTKFAVPILNAKKAVDHYTVYGGTLLIRNDADGKSYLYDLLDIEKKKVISAPSFSAETHSEVFAPKPSTDSISTSSGKVNGKFSLKSTDSAGRQLSEQQQEYFKDSKVRDAEGRLMPLYHQTDAEFTVFDTRHKGAGTGDNETPFGVFLKKSSKDIGVKGNRQMELYANIKNPLQVRDRSELVFHLARMSPEYEALKAKSDVVDKEYGRKFEKAKKDFVDFIAEWRRQNPNASRSALYEVDGFNRVFDAEDNIVEEWGKVKDELALQAKETITAALRNNGYDGVIISEDSGSFGRTTDAYIALDANQVKRTDNLNPTGDSDIRFQLKSATELEQEVRELKKERRALENRNKVLTERVAKWRGELRRTETPSVRPDDVKKLGRKFLSDYGSSIDYRDIEADMTALGKALMADDVSMETLRPHARAAAEKIIDGVLVQTESGGELLAIRDHLKNVTLRYTDDGSIPDFKAWKKANRGTLKISDKSGLDVDVAYSELTEMFGEGYFPSDIIHPDDQLLRISEVLEDVGRIYENPFDSYRDAAVTELADMLIDGMIGEDVRQSSPTFADRQALELQEAKARLTQMLIKTREGRDRQVARMQRHYQEQTKAGRERRNATSLRAKIARHTADLSRKLLNPTDKQHIPETLRQSVAALLGSINQESAYSYDENGKLVHNADGDPTKRTQAAIALKAAYNEIRNSGELVIDPDLLGSEGAGLLDQVEALSHKRIADMNSEELTTVWQAVRAIEHSVSTYNRNLAIERYAGVQEMADALRSGTASRRRVNRGVALDLYDPYSFFYGYGEAGMQIYRTLRNAQDKQNTMLKAIQDAVEKFMDEAVYKSRTERHVFFVGADGKRLVLTTGQIMNLYNLMRRGEQAVHHMTVGGVVQPAIEKKGKQAAIDRGTENIRLTMDDLKAITGTLTEADKRVAEGLQKIASGYLAKQGNESSMTVYGYRKFTERNYWPIKVTKEGTTQNAEKSPELPREIRNIGSAKPLTPNASNALEMADVFDVFAQNASDMIQYSTLLAPMEDINRIYNYRYRDAEGNLTGKNVKQVLTDVYGEAAPTYWSNLMRDLQNGLNSTGTDTTRLVEKLVGNAKGASVGFNVRVVIQQPTAYVRAAAILDPSTMAKGMAGGATEGSGWEKAKRYAPIASIKDTTGFDQSSRYSIARNIYGGEGGIREKLNDWSGWAAGKADAVTWGAIWNACEWTVVNEGGYERGSDAFYARVAQVFTDVIDQSQVVDGILQRTQIMRDKGGLAKQATAFMGEPLKTLNMFMRAYDAWRFEQNIPKRSAAMKKMTRTIGAVLVTDIVNALVQSLVDAFRADDKDKNYWERYLEKLTGITGDKEKDNLLSVLWGSNLWDNMDPLGRHPYLKNVKSLMQGFTVSRMDADTVGEFISAMQLFIRSAQGEGKKTTLYAAKQLLTTGSKIFGISLANAGRDAWAIARSIARDSGNVRIMYEMERAIWRLAPDAGNNTRYYKLLYMAMERDKDAYQYIYDDMKKRGYSDKQLQDGMKKIIKDSDVSDTDMKAQLEEIGYSSEEAQGVMDMWAFNEKYGFAYTDKREAFVEGAITRQQLISEMVSVGGKTREEAEKYATQLQCEIDTGISYDDLRGAYSSGKIRYDQAVSYLKRYGGKDDEDATETVEKWKFMGNSDAYDDISAAAVAKYNEYCAGAGMSKATYYAAWSVIHTIKGEDYNGDGENDAYSKMDKQLEYIGSLGISYDQMRALALACGISEKTLDKRAPW